MRIEVRVKPRARRTEVSQLGPNRYQVAVSAAPHDGEANEAVVDALSEHFGVARSRVRIVRGHRGRTKLVEIV